MGEDRDGAVDEERPTPAMRLAQRVESLAWVLLTVALLGGIAQQVVMRNSAVSQEELVATVQGRALAWVLSGVFVLSVLFLLPVSSLLRRRATRLRAVQRGEVPSFFERSGGTGRALPPWIGWPLWTLVTLASILLIYVLVAYSIPEYIASRFR